MTFPGTQPPESLSDSVKSRFVTTCKIACCLIFDALLFGLWLAIDWGVNLVAAFFEARGGHEYVALAFKWASSGGTFILAVVYIVGDIVHAARTVFKK